MMGRFNRVIRPGLMYHIINRGNNREAVFLEDEDFEKYLGLIYRFKKKYEFKLFAYCLMTNHVHLLINPTEKGTISRIMQSITVAHTRHYHFKYRRSGHIWQGRFSSPIVSADEYLLNVMRYIEQNPLRAKMVAHPGDYRWSSYRLNVRKEGSRLIDREENVVFQGLGETVEQQVKAYRDFVMQQIEDGELEGIRKSVIKGTGYFSEKFREQAERYLPRKRRPGRPSKQERDDAEIVRKLL